MCICSMMKKTGMPRTLVILHKNTITLIPSYVTSQKEKEETESHYQRYHNEKIFNTIHFSLTFELSPN